MFGVVPKSLWQRTNPADDNNMCDWTMRLLLIEDGDRLILFDTGIGELFVVRVAGNVANISSIASMEYAVAHLGTKLIVGGLYLLGFLH